VAAIVGDVAARRAGLVATSSPRFAATGLVAVR